MSDEPPLSQYIGLIIGSSTGRCYAVVNPSSDAELDNPRHLLLQNEVKEPVRMAKVDRGAYTDCMTPEDVAALLEQWHADEVKRIMESPPYSGPDWIEGAT